MDRPLIDSINVYSSLHTIHIIHNLLNKGEGAQNKIPIMYSPSERTTDTVVVLLFCLNSAGATPQKQRFQCLSVKWRCYYDVYERFSQ